MAEKIIIQEAPEFKGVEESRTAYERAVNALDVLPVFTGAYRAMLLGHIGVTNPYAMPRGAIHKDVNFGELELKLEAHRKTSVSAKGIVQGWESQLGWIGFLSQEGEVAGYFKERDGLYATAEKLIQDFMLSVYSNLTPSVELNADMPGYSPSGEIILPTKLVLDANNARTYLDALRIEKGMEALVKKYKDALKTASKPKSKLSGSPEIVQPTKKVEYKIDGIVAEKTDWGYVVKTLVTLPTEEDAEDAGERELEILADETMPFREKKEELGELYAFREREGTVIVGLDSVGERIRYLKSKKDEVESVRVGKRERLKPLK